MRILFLCHKMPFPPVDGGAIATLNMLSEFANQGHKVSVLAMQTPKHACSINDIPASLVNIIEWHQEHVDTTINPFYAFLNLLFSRKPYNAIRFNSKQYSNKLIHILRNSEFDIIQLEGLYLSPYINTIRKNSKALIALRAHNVEWKIWLRLSQTENSVFKKRYYNTLSKRIKALEIKTLKLVDVLIPITEKDKSELPFNKPENCFVSSTGIPKNKFLAKASVKNQTLFHIGALDWIPNQEGVLWFVKNVWVNLYDSFKHWEFVIAGRKAPQSFINELSKYPVKFVGEVENAVDFIDEHEIQIVPLLAGSGMRIKIIEGMSRSKCIVTTSVGAEGIPVTNTENIIIADTALDMIESLSDIMSLPEKVASISANAYDFALQNYTNEVLVSKLVEFYQTKLA